ncbi:ATP-binding protein [Pseudomonas aeruginosa]|uniref:ATP-binding protein n=1 Tax=Pseudomonas aeruginosa TaxID=287 RepID=UPI00226DF42E|nr:ATP-binding protein [Pseudomonas aeruginosa]MCY0330098.1 ATP-binding protein [Pseudomonas aeruginosa]MCY0347158.1 ATP-binding protein [Pseudomonas aeruginosa]
MDAVTNPYAPGAGTRPPELAGRDDIRSRVAVCIARLQKGRHDKSILMVGLRGVGKTVLLDQMRHDAEAAGAHTLRIEAPEDRSLPAILAPQFRIALLRLSRIEAAKDFAIRGLKALAGFAGALKVSYADIEVGIDAEAIPGLADNGDLESDLGALLCEAGQAAQKAGTVLVMFIDEMQYIAEDQFGALISALHRCNHEGLPITLVGAGLPQLLARAGNAKSYAERLFDFPMIGALDRASASRAITKPAEDEGVAYDPDAVDQIVDQTHGYPYFLQEWGKHSWDAAPNSPISANDVGNATQTALAALDESFFRVRLDRLTPAEKRYLRAMAELGPGPHRSGDIAEQLKTKVQSVAPTRNGLITKGMIWSPSHGDTAFTVPLFDEFMKRIMP